MTVFSGFSASSLGRLAALYAGAVICGALAEWINIPLPWMMGALVFTIVVSMSGVPVNFPRPSRPAGQMIVSASVGLTFTPDAVAMVVELFGAIVGTAVLTILAAILVAVVLRRMTHVDAITAGLASVPLGPVETANIAARYHVPEAPVVFSQVLRIVLLILLIPPALIWIDGTISDPTRALRETEWTWDGALLLLAAGVGGGVLASRLGISNPFFLGPLAVTAAGAALTLPLTAFPYAVLALGQLMLGTSLGAAFRPDFLKSARNFIPAAFAASLLLIALTTGIGLLLARLLDQPWPVMVLATAPGSVTEMALTAKVLQQGVALVTAFHIVRIFLIMPIAPVLFRLVARLTQPPPGRSP